MYAVALAERGVHPGRIHLRNCPAAEVLILLLGGLVESRVQRPAACSPGPDHQTMSPTPSILDQHADLIFQIVVRSVADLVDVGENAIGTPEDSHGGVFNDKLLKTKVALEVRVFQGNASNVCGLRPSVMSASAGLHGSMHSDRARDLPDIRTGADVPRHMFDSVVWSLSTRAMSGPWLPALAFFNLSFKVESETM